LYLRYIVNHNYCMGSKLPYEPIIVPTLLLKCAFHIHDLILRQPFIYRDDYPMLAVKLCDIQTPSRLIYPAFSTVQAAIK